jgi:hypothetical protein
MTTPLWSASAITSTDRRGHAIVRCLHGPEPEHRAREVLASVLVWLGLEENSFEAGHAINELVTNARLHAPPPYELRIYVSANGVKIAVVDGGIDHAEVARRLEQTEAGRPTGDESGRGLQLVAGLFPGRCGAEAATTCVGLSPAKQVWISLPLDRLEGEPGDAPS